MTSRTRWLLVLAPLFLMVPPAWGAIDTRCVADGGVAHCTEPTITADPATAPVDTEMWTYALCDMAGTFASRETAWSKALGGKPIFDPDVVPVSISFEQFLRNACQVNVNDSGWGYTIPSNILCWSGATLVKNQKPYREFRRLDLSGLAPGTTGCNAPWAETVFALRGRKIACPQTYNTRTKANGDLECWKLPPECSPRAKVANPITLLDGCKVQRELDYRSRTPGGVEVERFYNSGGYFRFDVVPERAADVWRTTWDRRIVAPAGAGAVLAYAQRADGSVLAFGSNGRELQNNQGGGSAVLQKLVDAAGATSGWRLATAEVDVETYDAAGRLAGVALRNGKSYALTYAEGRLATVSDIFGGTITFTYDGSGRLGGFVAPGNRVYAYGYDAMGRLVSVTHPDSTVRTYHYEDPVFFHALTGITDENGARYATWGYDSMGRATLAQHAGGVDGFTLYYGSYSATANDGRTLVVDGFGTTRTYYYQIAGGVVRIRVANDSVSSEVSTFDANGNTSIFRDANGVQTSYTYDLARNLEISRTEAYGTAVARTVATQWHPVQRLPTKITGPSSAPGVSEVTDFAYDERGNLLQKTVTAGAKSRQWTMTYTPLGQLLTVDGPRADVADVVSHTYYDPADPCAGCRGNVKTTTNALGHVTAFDAYDVDGQPLRITDANGVATTMTYDVRGRIKTRTAHAGSPLAETTSFDYDAAGQIVRTTMPDGSVLRYQYDAAHRLTEIADGLGNVTQYTLDAMGNRIKEDTFDPADRLQRTRRRVFDALNRLYNDIGADGQKSIFGYDGIGNLKTSTDALGRSSTTTYDPMNRMATLTDAAGGIVRYGYDAKDRLASVKDPIGLTTSYTYDAVGNLVQLSSPDTGITTYAADAAGNTVGSTDARGLAAAYAYDAINRQTLATFTDGSVALEYDDVATGGAYAKGRLTRVTDASGSTSYLYDPFGRVSRKTQAVGSGASAKTFVVAYEHLAGRTTSVTYPSGKTLSYGFDTQGRITSISVAGQGVLAGATYAPFGPVQGWTWANGQVYRRTYDLDGRVATLTVGPDSTAFANGNWTFGYDSLDRLASAALPAGEAFGYAYDANGNRKQETRGGAATNYGYFAASNRLQVLAGTIAKSFVYDASGNLAGNGGLTFTYDARGRMTQVSSGYRYAINGLGQRVSKTGSGETTYFVYDEQGRLIGEYDASGASRQELAWLSDTPVASLRPAVGGGIAIYPIYTDHLNTPRLITDLANRTVWEWPLDTFGSGSAKEDPNGLGTFSFNLRFPGQYYDAETGLHYNYFRDYDPSVGRYVESDPIGLKGGLNSYGYVEANPLSSSDQLGLDKTWWVPGSGRSTADGPRNGNWCGGNWGGGWAPSLHAGKDGPGAPLDSLDRCCMHHDQCWSRCEQFPGGPARGACMIACDRIFVACLNSLGDDCKSWPETPRVGTESDSQFYRDDAVRYFRERIRKFDATLRLK
jgi:RHS repeat-associated protein